MYVFDGRIRYSEIGADGRLTPEKLIDYFQDCSSFQSEDAGAGDGDMRRKGLAWVIVYWRVEISRMPRLGERVRVGTLPYEMKGGMGFRNFLMETQDGERLAAANSVWSLIDTKSSRPVRIPAEILERYHLGKRIEMRYDSRKIRIPNVAGETRPELVVKEYHLDTNRHVNNGQYVRLAAGLLPEGAVPDTLRIEYRRQAVLGDRITPVIYAMSSETGNGETEDMRRQPRKDSAHEVSRDTEVHGLGEKDLSVESALKQNLCREDSPAEKTYRTVWISLNAEGGQPYAVLEIGYWISREN